MKPGHDQYVHRHANGYFMINDSLCNPLADIFAICVIEFKSVIDRLCVVGLAPHHLAFKDKEGIVSVDFNVGKSDRSGIKVTGKRKKVNFCFRLPKYFCSHIM